MMKKVSSGECCHVVQMVGCVSTALPLALAQEFVPFGDLLSYLKYWRQKASNVHLSVYHARRALHCYYYKYIIHTAEFTAYIIAFHEAIML